MAVAFFISGHGFGHASRQVEVINALGRLAPGLRIVIRSAARADLLERTLTVGYELRPGATDTGIIQSSSVTHDDEATVRAAVAYFEQLDERVVAEADALAHDHVQLVVGDIPPVAFEVATRLDVPSLAIANFTWDWIYETHPGMTTAAPWLVPRIKRAYAQATLAMQLPFAGGFEVFPHVRTIPLIARRPTRRPAETRAHFRVPADRPMVLLSFGGYGLPALDLRAVDCLEDWTVVTTDRITPGHAPVPPGVVFLEEAALAGSGFRYEDLVAAADVVMTKPGYGIIAECIAADTAMLYTSRGEFREYDVLVRELPRYVRSRFINQDDVFSGRWRATLEALRAQPAAPETMATGGAEVAARTIRDALASAR